MATAIIAIITAIIAAIIIRLWFLSFGSFFIFRQFPVRLFFGCFLFFRRFSVRSIWFRLTVSLIIGPLRTYFIFLWGLFSLGWFLISLFYLYLRSVMEDRSLLKTRGSIWIVIICKIIWIDLAVWLFRFYFNNLITGVFLILLFVVMVRFHSLQERIYNCTIYIMILTKIQAILVVIIAHQIQWLI